MLLPSAFNCDSSQPPPHHGRLQSALFISPPTSPHHPHNMSTQSAIGNLINSCRNLHKNLLSSSPSSHSSQHSHLPSPPLANAPSPSRPRLRKRELKPTTTSLNTAAAAEQLPSRHRIKKRVPPPRGVNKRRRAIEDDGGRDDYDDSASSSDDDDEEEEEQQFVPTMRRQRSISVFEKLGDVNNNSDMFIFRGAPPEPTPSKPRSSAAAAPSTPKRQRIAPPEVPRGLTAEDYHKIGAQTIFEEPLQLQQQPQQQQQQQQLQRKNSSASSSSMAYFDAEEELEVDKHGETWSLEDDSKLVEIVLEKVKNMDLSREVWEDCVRNLPGRDYAGVSSRWKTLLRTERIGLQRGRRNRPKLHGTW